ncbi:MAG: glycosyltransferase family 2 protein, partial [Methylovulum sp.]|nr:glycosyltransferase family 2 protein [Methylovulum sp.]
MLSFWGILGQMAANCQQRPLPLPIEAENASGKTHKRLVMTLLVRNEADVIEGNLRFHLDHGVDFIVVTDNGSSDGTTEILEEYAKQGVVHLIHESSRVFQQRAWVNRMGAMAYAYFAADMIFHADADELWHPASGSLKTELCAYAGLDVLSVPVRNMLIANRGGAECFPGDII